MKKFCFVICCILMLPMLLVGCGKEETNLNIKEDFIEIQSIEYSTSYSSNNFPTTHIRSRFFIEFETNDVSKTDYDSASYYLEDYEYANYISDLTSNYPNVVGSITINKEKNNIPDISNDKLNSGTTYYAKYDYYGDGSYFIYRSYEIKSFKVVYVQMKIISDSVIEIIDNDEHYIVQTVYYKANFFN